jgi:hypothetical protein
MQSQKAEAGREDDNFSSGFSSFVAHRPRAQCSSCGAMTLKGWLLIVGRVRCCVPFGCVLLVLFAFCPKT